MELRGVCKDTRRTHDALVGQLSDGLNVWRCLRNHKVKCLVASRQPSKGYGVCVSVIGNVRSPAAILFDCSVAEYVPLVQI